MPEPISKIKAKEDKEKGEPSKKTEKKTFPCKRVMISFPLE
jgi:hypothetical protein